MHYYRMALLVQPSYQIPIRRRFELHPNADTLYDSPCVIAYTPQGTVAIDYRATF